MGLFTSFLNKQLIEIVERVEEGGDALVWRFPCHDNAIKMGAKLTVREGQSAVFVREGQLADVFPPGLYALATENLPVLTALQGWKHGFRSPFKAEVYFVDTRQALDRKWGTRSPILLRDPELGAVQVRAHGACSVRVADPATFLREVVGSEAALRIDRLDPPLRRAAVAAFTTALGKAGIPAIDLAAHYETLAAAVLQAMQPEFEALGIRLTGFVVESISLPEAVQAAVDKRASMGILGDPTRYAQFQAADALRDAARNPGGVAGAGVSLGAGAVLGQLMGQSLAAAGGPPAPAGPRPAPPATSPAPAAAASPPAARAPVDPGAASPPCAGCGATLTPTARFCPECGQPRPPAAPTNVPCVGCSAPIRPGSRFCPECGQPQQASCPGCGASVQPGGRFCAECGHRME